MPVYKRGNYIIHAIILSLIGARMLTGCEEQSASKDQDTHVAEPASENAQTPTRSILDDPTPKSEQLGDEDTTDEASEPQTAIHATDGYPTGQSTPEGAACDFARSFITADSELFKSVCLSWSAGESGAAYTEFIEEMVESMNSMKGKSLADFGGPKEITAVYKARYLTKSGPASFGYAFMNLVDVQFVDVLANTWEGTSFRNRTLVVQKSNKIWCVVPRPDLFPLLSSGLNSESESSIAWD